MTRVVNLGLKLIISVASCLSVRSFHPHHRRAATNFLQRQVRKMATYEGPLKIGLTGSIGMGKSTISNELRRIGYPVFDADEAVHKLYANGGKAVEPLRQVFPSAVVDNVVCRKELSKIVINDSNAIKNLEQIVHPLVVAERELFTEQSRQNGDFMIFYDIPLLFENRAQYNVDYIIVVSADPETQRRRVLSRPGMTEEKFNAIMQKQVPDEEKRRQADFVIETNFPGYDEAKSQLKIVLQIITDREKERWEAWRRHKENRTENCT